MHTADRTTRTRTTRAAVRAGALSAAAALALLVAACGGSDSGSMSGVNMPTSSATSSTTTSPSTTASSTGTVDAEHNDQDVMFAQTMIVHHQGAIEMSKMATTRTSSQQVKDLATKIEAAQQPEIEEMTSWLSAWGAPVTADSSMGSTEGMDHSSMGSPSMSGASGMMTEEQMTQLQNATGADFDRMFLTMMIEHHTGAIQMAGTEQQKGTNPQAQELADSIVTSQSAEIEQMQQMFTTLQ